MEIYPLLFKPVYKNYIWGGDKLKTVFQRDIDSDCIAESWEIADHSDGMSVALNGLYKGKTLDDLVKDYPLDLVGIHCDSFPLLFKIIDAKNNLSVQVHPDETIAKKLKAEPKTEMWIVLDAQENSLIYKGFNKKTDKEALKKAIVDENVEEILCEIKATKNETVFIPAGTVHAIGKGCLIYEIQQNSNTTYRVYDWNRVQKDGTKRDLHITEALQSIHFDKPIYTLENNPYFSVETLIIEKDTILENAKSFVALFAAEGSFLIGADGVFETLNYGTSCLIPAKCTNIEIIPKSGGVVIKTMLPQ